MSTLLGFGLLLVGCLLLASIPVSFFLGAVIRLSKDSRPARPPAADAGGSFPVVTAAGARAPRIRRGTSPAPSSLALFPGDEGGPADPNSAGPSNSTP